MILLDSSTSTDWTGFVAEYRLLLHCVLAPDEDLRMLLPTGPAVVAAAVASAGVCRDAQPPSDLASPRRARREE